MFCVKSSQYMYIKKQKLLPVYRLSGCVCTVHHDKVQIHVQYVQSDKSSPYSYKSLQLNSLLLETFSKQPQQQNSTGAAHCFHYV